MADEGDVAAEIAEARNADAVAAFLARNREAPSVYCIVCEIEIPKKRRATGACRCIHCQQDHEKRNHQVARR